jgi:hypothetical protein
MSHCRSAEWVVVQRISRGLGFRLLDRHHERMIPLSSEWCISFGQLIDLATVAMIAAGSWVNDNARRELGLG